MHWTFKDRYQPHLTLNVDYDMPSTLERLADTVEEFRYYETLEGQTAERYLKESENFVLLMIHIALSSVYAVYDENYLFDYKRYEQRVRKHFTDVHPAFAAKAFADCFCKIRFERSFISSEDNECEQDFIFSEKE
ncbi:hypothetical protein AO073_01755 [Pseudomonas syringae ICMP 11293]|uniref:hypothetical protein n=1 Tax=Pseudomonas syringae TaxID=317 RepID=UPI000731D39B|nr:hypothetical protein [Pseudomonas syringae]KTB91624.1 hypothetical protein AO073_01755 [Pseudomonas syringae ICMP 11293]